MLTTDIFSNLQNEINKGRVSALSVKNFLKEFDHTLSEITKNAQNMEKIDWQLMEICKHVRTDGFYKGTSIGRISFPLLAVHLQLAMGSERNSDLRRYLREQGEIEGSEMDFLSKNYAAYLFGLNCISLPPEIRAYLFNRIVKDTEIYFDTVIDEKLLDDAYLDTLSVGATMLCLAHGYRKNILNRLSQYRRQQIINIAPPDDILTSELLLKWGLTKSRRWWQYDFDNIKYKYLNPRWIHYKLWRPVLIKRILLVGVAALWLIIILSTGSQYQKVSNSLKKITSLNHELFMKISKTVNR